MFQKTNIDNLPAEEEEYEECRSTHLAVCLHIYFMDIFLFLSWNTRKDNSRPFNLNEERIGEIKTRWMVMYVDYAQKINKWMDVLSLQRREIEISFWQNKY